MPRDPRSSRWTRREALHLMGAGAAGLSFVTACGGQPAPESPPGDAAAPTETAPSPQARIIRTLLDDISPDDITGVTLFHEHLSVKLSARMTATDDVDNIVQEIRTAATEGLGCIVDGGHPDMSRDLDACRRVANETDVHVVAAGGYYMERFYPPDLATKSDDQIADELVEEAIRDRLGAFGEIGQTSDVAEMTPLERKVFRAVGKAHVRSGIPIFTHNAYGTGPNVTPDQGLVQLDLLESVGVDPRNVVIGHACCLDDPTASVLKQIAARGAFVGFDRVTGGRVDDPQKVMTILAFLEAGHADRLLISSDYTGRRSPERPGYGNAITVFAPLLRDAGVDDDTVRQVLYDNPRRFLGFVPRAA
jgi:phosphotriesterase-related protein